MSSSPVSERRRLALIQPVVLVGGRSSRFGRDKLQAEVGDGWLVDRPIEALRAVFGRRVAVLGICDPAVAARGDLLFEEHHPGRGPAGGVLSALQQTKGDVFVLAGDLPSIDATTIRTMLDVARDADPAAYAILAQTPGDGSSGGGVHPCIGLYRAHAAARLAERMSLGQLSLHDAFSDDERCLVAVDAASTHNVNTPADLADASER